MFHFDLLKPLPDCEYDKDGRFHNINGPSIIHDDGRVCWHFHGTRYRLDEWCEKCGHSKAFKIKMILKYD